MSPKAPQPPGDEASAVERILCASRPKPDPVWQERLEASLLSSHAPGRGPLPERREPPGRLLGSRFRLGTPWLVGGAAAGGLASFLLVLGLVGAGPLSSERDSAVKAEDNCRYGSERHTERVPRLVVRSGQPVIKYERKLVRRTIRRCD